MQVVGRESLVLVLPLLALLAGPGCDEPSSGRVSGSSLLTIKTIIPPVGGLAGGSPARIEANLPPGVVARDVSVQFGSKDVTDLRIVDGKAIALLTPAHRELGSGGRRVSVTVQVRRRAAARFFFEYVPPRVLMLRQKSESKGDGSGEELPGGSSKIEAYIITQYFALVSRAPGLSLVRAKDGKRWPVIPRSVFLLDSEREIERLEFDLGSLNLAPAEISGADFFLEVASDVGADRVPMVLKAIDPPTSLAMEPIPYSARIRLGWTEPALPRDEGEGYDFLRLLRVLPTGSVEEALLGDSLGGTWMDGAVDRQGFHRYGIYEYALRGGVYRDGEALESSPATKRVAMVPPELPVDVVLDLDPGLPLDPRTSGKELLAALAQRGRNPLRVEGNDALLLGDLLGRGDARAVWVPTGSTSAYLVLPSEEVAGLLLAYRDGGSGRIYLEGGDLFRTVNAGGGPLLRQLLLELGLKSVASVPFVSGLEALEATGERTFRFKKGIGPLNSIQGSLAPLAVGSAGDVRAEFLSASGASRSLDNLPGTFPESRYDAVIASEDGRAVLASLEFKNLSSEEEKLAYVDWLLAKLGLAEAGGTDPLVERVSLSSGCVNSPVTVTAEGRNLGSVSRVVLGGYPAQILQRTSSAIRFATPARDPTTLPGKVYLQFFDGTGRLLPVLPPHDVFELEGISAEGLTPPSSHMDIPALLTLKGRGFERHGISEVRFGEARIPREDIEIRSDREIAFLAPPPQAAGATLDQSSWIDVEVISSACNHAFLRVRFAYLSAPAPRVDSFSPPSGCSREAHEIKITGANLDRVQTIRRQEGAPLTFRVLSPTEIRFSLPPRAGNAPGVEVLTATYLLSNGSEGRIPLAFEHQGFTATSVAPSHVCLNGDARFLIQGTRFLAEEQRELSCRVGGVEVPWRALSDTELEVSLPSRLPLRGSLPVALSTSCLQVELSPGVTVSAVEIGVVTPRCACLSDPGVVTISGACLESIEALSFGQTRVERESFLQSSEEQIRLAVPRAEGPGAVLVRAETSAGESLSLGSFTYAGAGPATLVSTSGYLESPLRLTIEGRFASCGSDSLKVCVGSSCAQGKSLEIQGGKIIATFPPPGVPGNLPVRVETECGAASAGTFECFEVRVDSIVPGDVCFGTPVQVEVTGSHLDYVKEVLLDGAPVPIRRQMPSSLAFDAMPLSTSGEIVLELIGKGGERVHEGKLEQDSFTFTELLPTRGSWGAPGDGSLGGSCLQSVQGIVFGYRPAVLTAWSDTRIDFQVPPASGRGEVEVVAVLLGGKQARLGRFFYTNDFFETFSGSLRGWSDDGLGGWDVYDGVYRWTGKGTEGRGALRYSLNERQFRDFTVSVRATKQRGTDFEVGIITRATPSFQDGYVFSVGCVGVTGYASICAKQRGILIPLLSVTTSRIFTKPGQTNVLAVAATGVSQRFQVNGVSMGIISDTTSLAGSVGLEVREQDGSAEEAPVVLFDDFKALEEAP